MKYPVGKTMANWLSREQGRLLEFDQRGRPKKNCTAFKNTFSRKFGGGGLGSPAPPPAFPTRDGLAHEYASLNLTLEII